MFIIYGAQALDIYLFTNLYDAELPCVIKGGFV